MREISEREKQSPSYLTLGDKGYRQLLDGRERLKVCMKCHYFEHDGDTQDICFPPSEDDCLLHQRSINESR